MFPSGFFPLMPVSCLLFKCQLLFNEFIKQTVLKVCQYNFAHFFQLREILLKSCEYCFFIDIGVLVCNEIAHSEHFFPKSSASAIGADICSASSISSIAVFMYDAIRLLLDIYQIF